MRHYEEREVKKSLSLTHYKEREVRRPLKLEDRLGRRERLTVRQRCKERDVSERLRFTRYYEENELTKRTNSVRDERASVKRRYRQNDERCDDVKFPRSKQHDDKHSSRTLSRSRLHDRTERKQSTPRRNFKEDSRTKILQWLRQSEDYRKNRTARHTFNVTDRVVTVLHRPLPHYEEYRQYGDENRKSLMDWQFEETPARVELARLMQQREEYQDRACFSSNRYVEDRNNMETMRLNYCEQSELSQLLSLVTQFPEHEVRQLLSLMRRYRISEIGQRLGVVERRDKLNESRRSNVDHRKDSGDNRRGRTSSRLGNRRKKNSR